MEFIKLEGLGNDFILVDALKHDLSSLDLHTLAPKLCDRHFGIGADGILVVQKSTKADYRMQIINPDGSEPQMCGNGIRCFARYIYETYEKKSVISVETLAGIILPVLDPKNNIIEVDMGEPKLIHGEKLLPVEVADQKFEAWTVSMGNPHAVIFVPDVAAIDLDLYGPLIENHPLFPERTNVEFIQVLNTHELKMRVWERGASETLACGTGACAAVVAAIVSKRIPRNETIVHLPGGKLVITWDTDDNHVTMAGPAFRVFEGTVKL
jgi:diaminopimelate epimerase